jgi:hypothetical protein
MPLVKRRIGRLIGNFSTAGALAATLRQPGKIVRSWAAGW